MVGDVIQAYCEFETDDDWSNVLDFSLKCICSGGGGQLSNLMVATVDQTTFLRPTSGVMCTPAFAIPSGTHDLYFKVTFQGTGTFRFGRCGLIKL